MITTRNMIGMNQHFSLIFFTILEQEAPTSIGGEVCHRWKSMSQAARNVSI